MILSYKQKFPWGVPTNFDRKINEGIKIHTIRDDIHNRWKFAMIIQHAYGVRTPNYRCFAKGQCMSTQILEIKSVDWRSVVQNPREIEAIESLSDKEPKVFQLYVDGRQLNGSEINDIARNDGFDSTEDFFKWFNEPCTKKIIHFTDFKY